MRKFIIRLLQWEVGVGDVELGVARHSSLTQAINVFVPLAPAMDCGDKTMSKQRHSRTVLVCKCVITKRKLWKCLHRQP